MDFKKATVYKLCIIVSGNKKAQFEYAKKYKNKYIDQDEFGNDAIAFCKPQFQVVQQVLKIHC